MFYPVDKNSARFTMRFLSPYLWTEVLLKVCSMFKHLLTSKMHAQVLNLVLHITTHSAW